jgi:hypothetical protein
MLQFAQFSDMLFNFAMGFLIEPHLWAPDSLGAHVIGLAQFFGQNGGRIAVIDNYIKYWLINNILAFPQYGH